MVSLFLSHSSADNSLAERLATWLDEVGFAAVFLDFEPGQGIPVGRNWERELYIQLRRANGLIFLATPDSVESKWCFAEIALARSLGCPVFPIRFDREVHFPLLGDRQWLDLGNEDDPRPKLRDALEMAGLQPDDSFAWDARRSPYPGLVPFASEDAAVFFGRESEARQLLNLLTPTLQRGAGQFVAIVGPSGSGKSSLLRAGLIPRLRRQPHEWIVLPPMLPGSAPTRNLAASLSNALSAANVSRPVDELHELLKQGSEQLIKIGSELAELNQQDGRRPRVLIVVDQAEELIVRTGPIEQRAFIGLLSNAVGEDSRISVIATLRSEYLSSNPERAGLAEAIDCPLVIEPLSRNRLSEAIQAPARRAAVEFEPGLVERMVDETAGGDAMPMLAYLLRELYDQMGQDGKVTTQRYDDMGGVVGALSERANGIYEDLTTRDKSVAIMPTLLKLATVSREDEPTRRRVLRSEFTADEQVVVDAFIDASLLISDRPMDPPDGEAIIQVAHEAILRQWAPLRAAIEADRAPLQRRSELERLAADWRQGIGSESYLLRGERLKEFGQWATDHAAQIGPRGREFLAASRALAVQEKVDARQLTRRRGLLAVGLVVVLVIALSTGTFALQKNRDAAAQSRLAESYRLADRASQLLPTRPDTAILIGVQSMSMSRGFPSMPPAALIAGVARLNHPTVATQTFNGVVHGLALAGNGVLIAAGSSEPTIRIWSAGTNDVVGQPLVGHTDAVNAVAFSADGRLLASASSDQTARLWNTITRKQQGQPSAGHAKAVRAVAFSPDGTLLSTASDDGTARLWDAATGQPHGQPLAGHTGGVNAVAFSPDGTLLATSSDDSTARLWDVATGQPHGQPLAAHTGGVNGIAFSPDGTLLATSSEDDTARLWDVATGERRGEPFIGHTEGVMSVAFNHAGTQIVTASRDRTVRLWYTNGDLKDQPIIGHTAPVTDAQFSSYGSKLMTSSEDGTVRTWLLADFSYIGPALIGHRNKVTDLAYSPDNHLLASSSDGQVVRLWDTAGGRVLSGHSDTVNAIAFSPRDGLLASAGDDGSVRLWDTSTGAAHGPPIDANAGAIWAVAFSPDGALLAAAGGANNVYLWDVATGQPRTDPMIGHTAPITGVAFSPDGTLLATASHDRTARLWDVASGRPRGEPLVGHGGGLSDVTFSPDGSLLATSSYDQTARLWNVANGQPHGRPFSGHTNGVTDVAFSPDQSLLATSSFDQTARLWNVANGQPHGQPFAGHHSALTGVAFRPDGKEIATASYDNTVRRWNISFTAWAAAGCALVRRNLSLLEWNEVAADLPYERTCPYLPSGQGAPPNAPAARYDDGSF